MPANLASNFPNVAALSNAVLAYKDASYNVWTLVENFLSTPTQPNYEAMVTGLNNAYLDASFQTQAGKLASGATKNMLRILVAIDDGTVAYDSGNAITADTSNNSWSSFTANTVNSSNHNTRPEVLTAVLSSTGVGISNRYSRTSAAFLKYQATRLGTSAAQNVGTFRVSITDQAV